METGMQQEKLRQIGGRLQKQLRLHLPLLPLRVQCALKENLMVLAQHPPGIEVEPAQVFGILEQALADIPADWLPDRPSPSSDQNPLIKLYLRVAGQAKPYAAHAFCFSSTANVSDQPEVRSSSEDETIVEPAEDETIAEPAEDRPLVQLGEIAPIASASLSRSQRQPGLVVVGERPAISPGRSRMPGNLQPWLLIGGGLVAAVLLGGSLYALTRPCVAGACQPLQTAQTLTQQSAQLLQGNPSEQAEQQARQQLTEAQRLVSEIPPWSGSYGEAQAVKQSLDQILSAESKAEMATRKGQVTAQSVPDWQVVESLWREAIAPLESVAQTSPLHPYAQQRLTAYRANLKWTEQRIATEQEARKRLLTAKQTVGLAEARQNTARELQDWQIAQSTWLVTMNALKQIPEGTTSYTEAQQLMQNYQPKLVAARDRVAQEQLAAKAYTQAVQSEQQAKAWQQKNQWSQAAASWQSVLNYAGQVPDETAVSSQAQTLAANAASALKQAQTVVKVRGDLDRICFASGKICDYTIQNDVIKVKFVSAYERRARTISGISYFSRDYETMYKIDQHFASLAKALQVVSTNSGIPIQVYNSDNQVLGSFVPGGGQ
ncbi:MAG: hypothetical protein ACP5RH_04875 [Leptodesmis sp.]|uniref:hypothetical protein n=1 Tax=Leptodesmis sp. TaxID=3100501 RepID=UPI003D0D47A5